MTDRQKLYVGPLAVLALACAMGVASVGVALWGLERGNQPHYFIGPEVPAHVGELRIEIDPPAKGRS